MPVKFPDDDDDDDLFEWGDAYARSGDPAPSHEAKEKVNIEADRAEVLLHIAHMARGQRRFLFTSKELREYLRSLGMTYTRADSLRSRLSDFTKRVPLLVNLRFFTRIKELRREGAGVLEADIDKIRSYLGPRAPSSSGTAGEA